MNVLEVKFKTQLPEFPVKTIRGEEIVQPIILRLLSYKFDPNEKDRFKQITPIGDVQIPWDCKTKDGTGKTIRWQLHLSEPTESISRSGTIVREESPAMQLLVFKKGEMTIQPHEIERWAFLFHGPFCEDNPEKIKGVKPLFRIFNPNAAQMVNRKATEDRMAALKMVMMASEEELLTYAYAIGMDASVGYDEVYTLVLASAEANPKGFMSGFVNPINKWVAFVKKCRAHDVLREINGEWAYVSNFEATPLNLTIPRGKSAEMGIIDFLKSDKITFQHIEKLLEEKAPSSKGEQKEIKTGVAAYHERKRQEKEAKEKEANKNLN